MSKIYLLMIIVCAIACSPSKKNGKILDGVWQSVGYGRILEIKNSSYHIYDVTKNSCLPTSTSPLTELMNYVQIKNDTLIQKQGILTYYYTRLTRLPDICNATRSDINQQDVLYNFEIFAQTINENFAYFELNNINWDSLYSIQKAKLNSNPTQENLYEVLNESLRLLNDNHGQVEPTEDVLEKAAVLKPNIASVDNMKEYGDFEIAQMVTQNFLEKDLTTNSKLIQWGQVNERIGYIQIKAMWLFANLNLPDSLVKANGWVSTYANEMTRLNEAEYINLEIDGVRRVMDRVMKDLFENDCIIVDVRFNGGGQDAVSLEILKRFNDKRLKIATQKATFGEGFTPEQSIYLDAHHNAYTKPVFVLTSRQSASATDLFAMATLSLNHVTRIGSKTNGAISTALERKLPNGWTFSISNELFLDNSGVCYENIGLPVNHELHYPTDRQTFFRYMADSSSLDKQNILKVINNQNKSGQR